jgi:hypothetical protein
MSNLKMVLTPSLYVFVAEIESLIAEGYSVDFENNPPTTFGICYECGLIKKNDACAEIFADTVTGAFASTTEPHVKPAAQRGRPKISK